MSDKKDLNTLWDLVRSTKTDGLDQYDLVAHLHRQREFSLRTFGPGERTEGVLDHIQKEIAEVRENPKDISEWIDRATADSWVDTLTSPEAKMSLRNNQEFKASAAPKPR